MNDFLTKEVELCGSNMSQQDSDAIGEIIYEALMERGIFLEANTHPRKWIPDTIWEALESGEDILGYDIEQYEEEEDDDE
jgi:hypothetical protein